MMPASNREKYTTVIANYRGHHQSQGDQVIHCVCALAILFSVIGILAAINFGIALIAIAVAILTYNRLGQLAAMQMAAVFIVMLAAWVTVMPAHYLVASAIGIFILAWTALLARHLQAGSGASLMADLRYLPVAPLYAMTELKQKLSGNRPFDSH